MDRTDPDGTRMGCLCLCSLTLVEDTKVLSEPHLSLKLQSFPAVPVLEKESFDSTVVSQEVEASETVDPEADLGFFRAGFFR